MPTTKTHTLSRVGTVAATAGLLALAAPASAQAWSWQDLFRSLSTNTAPVTQTATDVASPVTDVVSEVVTPETTDDGTACPTAAATQAFARFGDTADYALAPGGDFEAGSHWTLTGGARIASGNENLGVSPGQRSLQLPIGATATSPEFCVDESQPHFRFVSKPDNAIAGYEAIVIYRADDGSVTKTQFTSSAAQSWGAGSWAPSSASPLATKIPLLKGGGKTASVQLMFVSTGNKAAVGVGLWGRLTAGSVGTVSVDSVMVDPYRRG